MSFSYQLTESKTNKRTRQKSLSRYLINIPGKNYRKGKLLYQPILSDFILFLEKGKVSIMNQAHQKIQFQEQFVDAGNFINVETAFNKKAFEGCSLQIETPAIIKKVSLENFNTLLNKPSFNQTILHYLANRSRNNQKKANRLRYRSSRGRVIQYLWDLANKKGKKIGYEMVIDFPPTQLEISVAAGTARQTATTNLLELRKRKIIHYNRRSLIFRDLDQLKQLLDETR